MKTIIIAILLLIGTQAYSQRSNRPVLSDTIVTGLDTIVVDTLNANWTNVYVTVNDTGATHTDSVAVESWDAELEIWVRIGAWDTYTNTFVSVLAAVNTARKYLLDDKGIYILRLRLINAIYVSGRRVQTDLNLINP